MGIAFGTSVAYTLPGFQGSATAQGDYGTGKLSAPPCPAATEGHHEGVNARTGERIDDLIQIIKERRVIERLKHFIEETGKGWGRL